MRCKNCGWPNKPGSTNCVKCNSPLEADTSLPPLPANNNVDSETVVIANENGVPTPPPAMPTPPPAPSVNEQPLAGTVREDVSAFGQFVPAPTPNVVPGGTVGEQTPPTPPVAPTPKNQDHKVCPKCGFPLRPGTVKCPNCSFVLIAKEVENVISNPNAAEGGQYKRQPTVMNNDLGSFKVEEKVEADNVPFQRHGGTVNPYIMERKRRFALTPLERKNEPSAKKKDYEGKSVVLNRSNTDPMNATITSKQQAVISFEDGKWFIEDKSGLQTTFVRAARKIELQKGDVILLGDRRFIFEDL